MSLTSYRAAPPRVTGRRALVGASPAGGLWAAASVVVRSERGVVDLGGPGGDRLSRALRHSTMGAEAFDGRVRDGIGSGGFAWATRPAKINIAVSEAERRLASVLASVRLPALGRGQDGHRVMRGIKPDERLVPVSCTHRCASTPGLSTWWSSTALQGELVSRWVSSLDAFSSYPVRT